MNKATRFLILTLLVFVNSLFAQAPSIDPGQTVNPATGEMGLSLPLGSIPGVSGMGYTATLSYKAGIRLHEQASPAGLGFG